MFTDREQAGKLLATELAKYKDDNGVVLAIPRGGVPIAFGIACALYWPLEFLLTCKIGHPLNKEYAIGEASLSSYFVIPHECVTADYINDEVTKVRARLLFMQKQLLQDRSPITITGKTVIVADDGIATGNTMIVTIELLRKNNPARMILAAPGGSAEGI